MKKLLNITLLLLSILSSEAFSSLGRKADSQTFPPGICRLTFKKIHYEDTYHCTGSLVSPTQIKTAGHCLEKAELKKVDCGGFQNLPIKNVLRFDSYDHRQIMREEENRWQDHALITLSKSVGLPPLKIVIRRKNLKELLPTFSQCLIAGFGLHEETSKGTGTLIG
ncbi:MAG: S1 family peptidase, partial [Halobacteriovoraceae bacterium]|nr:S1 family peptidase [Halobacteriovoraceae bacterium]